MKDTSLPHPDTSRNQITILHGESLSASMRNLAQPQMFFYPGAGVEAMMWASGMPLHETVGQSDVDAIMSNRRFLKVFAELSKLPKADAGARIEAEIRTMLPVYKELYQENLAEVYRTKMVQFTMPHEPSGTPDLRGERLSILSMILIAGNLHMTNTHALISEIAEYAVLQRDTLYRDETKAKDLRQSALRITSLYNRQILATRLIGTSRETDDDSELSPRNLRFESAGLTLFDAKVSRYEPALSPDFSKGKFRVRYMARMNDVVFDSLRKSDRATAGAGQILKTTTKVPYN